jgi:hypothetical protein
MPWGMSKKKKRDCHLMELITFWSVMMALIYLAKTYINTIKRNRNFVKCWRGSCYRTNRRKSRCVFSSSHLTTIQNHYKKTVNELIENVAQFRYLGTTATNQTCTNEEIKSRLTSGNVQNVLTSHLLSKNVKIKMHTTLILSVVLYGCESWSLTLKEDHRFRVSENKVFRRI